MAMKIRRRFEEANHDFIVHHPAFPAVFHDVCMQARPYLDDFFALLVIVLKRDGEDRSILAHLDKFSEALGQTEALCRKIVFSAGSIPDPLEEVLGPPTVSDEQGFVQDLFRGQPDAILVDLLLVRELDGEFRRFGAVFFEPERLKGNGCIRFQVEGIPYEPADEGEGLEKVCLSGGVGPEACQNFGNPFSLVRIHIGVRAGRFFVDHEADLVFLFEGIEILDAEFPDHFVTYKKHIFVIFWVI
jgi:hypothetical protein